MSSRMQRALVPLVLLVLCEAGIPPVAAPPEHTSPDHPVDRWREGPVRYIITAEEDREFKQLSSDEARGRFIERFWARRDPNASTLVNEFRREFWVRVHLANQLFTDSAKPGWKTDMGRYYILLGPPDDRDTQHEMPLGLGRTGIRGAITWRYSHAPSQRIGTGVKIVFVRDASGEFRASTDPAIVGQVLTGSLASPIASPTAFGIPLVELPSRLSEMQLMLDLGRLEEVPTEEDLLSAIVTAEEFYGVIAFSARYDFFAGSDDRAFAALTLIIHPDPLDPAPPGAEPDYLIVGRIDPIPAQGVAVGPEEPGEPVFLRESDFNPGPQNLVPRYRGPHIYQAVTLLAPGRYRAHFAVFDRVARRTGTYSGEIEVPEFARSTLELSSLCLSESIEPVSGRDAAPAPYVIGHLKVTPRLVPSFRNGETFAVYYQ
ncbi:MAG TPA: GWxTD domain-containing protein, partial [Candidatus Polarisedimenticolia bacterium]|nr:GWxTD domain-containing protein [Candidatus Polarisedimenticolia bacterium]